MYIYLLKIKKAFLSFLCLSGILLYSFCGSVWALSSDREKPIQIEADLADINDKTGISVYTGNVIVVQGSMRITAQVLTVYTKDKVFTKMISTGNPATFRQRPDGKDENVAGEGKRIEYFGSRDTAYFYDNAKLEQAGSTFRSDHIAYDILNDKVNAGITSGDDRVKIIIKPQSKQ